MRARRVRTISENSKLLVNIVNRDRLDTVKHFKRLLIKFKHNQLPKTEIGNRVHFLNTNTEAIKTDNQKHINKIIISH